MTRHVLLWCAVLGLVLGPSTAAAQFGGGFGGGRGRGMGGEGYGPRAPEPPKMPGAELEGPADSTTATEMLGLSNDQAAKYGELYAAYRTATQRDRDGVEVARGKMNDRLDAGDRAAAEFYAEEIQDFGKALKQEQDKFEKGLRHLLNGDQIKSYQRWKDDQDRAAEERNREAALRWRQMTLGGGARAERTGGFAEQKSYPRTAAVSAPDLGSQAVRVGRTVYAAQQLALDSTGVLVARGDVHDQAVRAFANLAAVLRAAGARPQDVVSLTIYVVGYQSGDLSVIRDAGAEYFGPNAPVASVLGVQSLGRDGAVISIGATAVTQQSAGYARPDLREGAGER